MNWTAVGLALEAMVLMVVAMCAAGYAYVAWMRHGKMTVIGVIGIAMIIPAYWRLLMAVEADRQTAASAFSLPIFALTLLVRSHWDRVAKYLNRI